MSTFNARLHLPGRARLPLGVEIDIQEDRITVCSGERTVAVLPLEDLEVVSRSDGFHLQIEGEEVVLIVADPDRFARELGIREQVRPEPIRRSQPTSRPVNQASNGPTQVNGKLVAAASAECISTDDQLTDLQRRIGYIADALRSESVTPAVAFGYWLGLVKELNRRHGQGTMSTDVYYHLNSRLLDLIPSAPVEQLTVVG